MKTNNINKIVYSILIVTGATLGFLAANFYGALLGVGIGFVVGKLFSGIYSKLKA